MVISPQDTVTAGSGVALGVGSAVGAGVKVSTGLAEAAVVGVGVALAASSGVVVGSGWVDGLGLDAGCEVLLGAVSLAKLDTVRLGDVTTVGSGPRVAYSCLQAHVNANTRNTKANI